MANEMQIDAFPPVKMASRMEEVGVAKATLNIWTMFALAVLAGAFIGTGAIFATVVTTGLTAAGVGYGIVKLLGGLVFCLGLVAVVVAGAELFTGNNLIVMAFASNKVTLMQLLRNWVIVYLGNFVGSILTAIVMLLTRQYMSANGALGANALTIANGKCSLDFVQAIALGIMCNALVCLAVWLCFSARSTTDKILAIIFPITAFVAAGFEHSIANMYFIPMGLLIQGFAGPEFWTAIGKMPADYASLTWLNFFVANLLPVTIGNIIGGAGFVGLLYWFIYLRPQKKVEVKAEVPVKILVVDDDPDFVEITRMILTKEGYDVSSASSGEQGYRLMKAQRPDLVLLDVMMATPLDGVDLARRMAQDAVLKHIPVIMISSIDATEHAALLPDDLHIPIDVWIGKPIDPDQLLKTIRRFL
ncbi:MAG: formate transporter FocA [Chloroflexi bacterium]|nr:formate transporter FocA [Chloroflexota bacterium]MBU1750766.1 formate transporter FocA [Chloroflexota bacterium]